MPKLRIGEVAAKEGSDYPAPFDRELAGREARNVAAAGNLVDFNANHVIVPPGCWSSQRHWHEGEDELVVVLSGSGVLIDDAGRHPMGPGDIGVFPKNDGNGHHLVNEGAVPLVLLAIGHPERTQVTYSDIDLLYRPGEGALHKDGTLYPEA